MAYNTSKGDRELGDIKNEADPDTQIDFENDQISLKTGGVNRLTATNTHVSCSVNVSASSFYGDGSSLTNVVSNPVGGFGDVQFNAGGNLSGSNNLSWDHPNSQLIVNGNVSGSFISASAGFVGDGSLLTNLPAAGVTGPGSNTDRSIAVFSGTNGQTITGSGPTIDLAGNISMPARQLTCNAISLGGTGINSSGPVSSSAVGTFQSIEMPDHTGNLNVSGSVILNSGSVQTTTVLGTLSASNGIAIPLDAKKLEIGADGDFYIVHNVNTALSAVSGHMTVDVETSGRNLRLQMGDDAGASSVQFRNNSSNTVASTDSLGIMVGSAYGLLGVASGSVSVDDVIVAVGYNSNFVKFSKASPNTLTHGRGPFYVAAEGASDGGSLRALKSKLVTGLNTSTATNVGDAVYLSATTSGSYVYTVPNPTADAAHFSLLVRVGRVVNIHASTGAIMLEPPGGGEPLVGQVLAGGGTSTHVAGFGAAFSGSQGSCAVLATANTDPAPGDDDQIKSARILSDGRLEITLDDSSGTPLLTYTIFA